MCVYMCGGGGNDAYVYVCVCDCMQTDIFKALSKYLISVSSFNHE